MAGNKFATMLHRNKTHKIGMVLIYTLLEWVLIGFLFVDAIFSYFISRYVSYFGLKPPCLLCSRLDHIFHSHRVKQAFFAEVVCHDHVNQISQFGFGIDHGHHHNGAVSLVSLVQGEVEAMALKCHRCGEGLMVGIDLGDLMVKAPFLEGLGGKGLDLQRKSEDLGQVGRGVMVVDGPKGRVGDDVDVRLIDGVIKLMDEEEKDAEVRDRAQAALAAALKGEEEEEEEEDDDNPSSSSSSSSLSSSSSEEEEEETENEEEEEVEEEEEEEEGEKKEALIDEDDREKRGTAIAGDTEHLYRSGSCKRVYGNDAILKVLYQCRDCASQVTERVYKVDSLHSSTVDDNHFAVSDSPRMKDGNFVGSQVRGGKIRMNGEQMFRFFRDMEKAENDTGPCVFTVEIENKNISPRSGESFLVSSVISKCLDTVFGVEEHQTDKTGDQVRESLSDAWNQFHDHSQDNIAVVNDQELARELGVVEDVGHHPSMSSEDEIIGGLLSDSIVTPIDETYDAAETEYKLKDEAKDADASFEVSIESENREDQEKEFQPNEKLQSPKTNSAEESIQGENADSKISHQLSALPEHNELDEDVPPELNKKFILDRKGSGFESVDGSVASDGDPIESLTVDHLKYALRAERKALTDLYAELEKERNASSVSADQTMAMINRLQEEKAAMQMELSQYKRMMDEQSEYDQEALHILDELAKKREKEKQDLMRELEVCRKRIHIYKVLEKKRLKKENADQSESGVNTTGAESDSSPDSGNEDGTNTPVTAAALNSVKDQGSGKYLSILNEVVAEFEEERISIINQLQALEEKNLALDDKKGLTDNNEDDDIPHDSTSMLVSERKRLAIAEEMENEYQKLQVIEEDKAFVRHCISSLKKGDEEIDLLYEILQHFHSVRTSNLHKTAGSVAEEHTDDGDYLKDLADERKSQA